MEFHNAQNLVIISNEQLQSLIEKAVEAALSKFSDSQVQKQQQAKYLSVKEVVELFGITRPTIDKLVKNNSIRAYRPEGVRRKLFIEEELREDLKHYPQK